MLCSALALIFFLKSVWAQPDCSYSMRFFDVDECERFNTPFVQTTIIADGKCRGQSTGRTGPGPYYQAVCGNDRIYFLKANCRDSACTDCQETPKYTNNFDGRGWTLVSPCIPLPESAYSFNIKTGSCDPTRCAVPTSAPTSVPRSEWPTWYEPTPSPPTASPTLAWTSQPSGVTDISTQDPTSRAVSLTIQPSLTQAANLSPENPTTAAIPLNQAPNQTTTVPPNQVPTEPVSSSAANRAQLVWAGGVLLLVFSLSNNLILA